MTQPAFPISNPSPTTPPPSLVQPVTPPWPIIGDASLLPAAEMRRTIVGWSNLLRHVYGEVQWLDDERATVIHAHHAAAVRRVNQLPALSFGPTQAALIPVEQQWADHVAATPMFLNAFGQKGWSINRVPLEWLAVVQPVIDVLHDPVPTAEDDIARWCLLESSALDYRATLAPDSQPGSFHVVLTAGHPNQNFDVELVEGGAGGVLLRLRPRPNYVAVIRLPHRFIVHNGHHRLTALAAAGVAAVPAVVLDPALIGQLQDRLGFLPFQQVAQLPRPPLVTDFLDPELTIDTPGRGIGKVHDFRIVHTELPSTLR